MFTLHINGVQNPIEIEMMSGSNSDSVEGKYEIAELVEINKDEINSMKFPGSLLLTPQSNIIPLSLSFIGKGNPDHGSKQVINGDAPSTISQRDAQREAGDEIADKDAKEGQIENNYTKEVVDIGTLVPQVIPNISVVNSALNPTLSLNPIVNNVENLNDWMSDESPISIKSDMSVYTDYDAIVDLFLPVQETEEHFKEGGQAVPSSPMAEFSMNAMIPSPGIGDARPRDSCDTTPKEEKKVRVGSDGKGVMVKKVVKKVNNQVPFGALFSESSDDEVKGRNYEQQVYRSRIRDRPKPDIPNSKEYKDKIALLKSIQAKKWWKLQKEEKEMLEQLAVHCHGLADKNTFPDQRSMQLYEDCRFLQDERDAIEFEKAWAAHKSKLRSYERRGLYVRPEEYDRSSFDYKSDIREASPRPVSSTSPSSIYCPWSPIVTRSGTSEERMKLKGMPREMRHAIDSMRRRYQSDVSPHRMIRGVSEASSALNSGFQ